MHRLPVRLSRASRSVDLSARSCLPALARCGVPAHQQQSQPSKHSSTRQLSTAQPLQAAVYSRQLSSSIPRQAKATTTERFRLADIGEGITEVEIVKWHVEDGQTINEFDPIVEVMSDKATVEITSPYSGVVGKLSGDVGTVMKVGGVLCEVEVESEGDTGPAATDSGAPGASSQSDAAADAVYEAIRASAPSAKPSPAPVASAPPPPKAKVDSDSVLASPATRRVARENNVHLGDIAQGSGKNGRVLPEDVLAFVSSQSAPSTSSSTTFAAGQPIPLSPLRRAMFKAMTQSIQIPHFAYSETIDVTALSRLRAILNKGIPLRYRATLSPAEEVALARQQQWGAPGRVPEKERFDKITLMPLLLKALSLAMAENPLFLCSLNGGAEADQAQLIPREAHDISVALASPSAQNGLFTPLIPSVDALSAFDIAGKLNELQAAAAATASSGGVPAFPKTAQARGTMTLSNVGAIGGRGTHPVIPPGGQLAIGAMGRVRCEAGYVDEEAATRVALGDAEGVNCLKVEPRLRMDVSFTADHRVVEGVELARLVETWKRLVERPERLVGLGK